METVMPNWLMKRASLSPDRIALEFNDEQYTFQQLLNEVKALAGKLRTAGVAYGEKVAVLLNNHPKTLFVLLAIQQLGATVVLLNHRLTSNELLWQLHDSKASILITNKELSQNIDSSITTVQQLESIELLFPTDYEEVQEFSLTDPCSIMYTSGTTGNPKGVIQTYGNHWWSAIGSSLNLGLHERDCWLLAVPLFHISGFSILMRSIIYGMRVILHDHFDEQKVNKDICEKGVTIISVVSAMLSRMIVSLKTTTYPDTFRCMLLGGGPAPLTLLEKCKQKGIPVYQTYGMTETASQVVTLAPEYSISKLGSAGKPLFPIQLKIISNEREAEVNEPGEILLKGPNITVGYLNNPDSSKQTIQNGWLYTGDIGRLDKDGFLYVMDRRSDLIISGGENIYPAEIENVLLAHPAILEAGVAGVEHERWGKVPYAFVVLKKGFTLDIDELLGHCRERLAAYKIPKKVILLDCLPRNASNKLLRRELPKMLKGIDK